MKRAGKNPQFLYDGFNAIFGPESYASAHASVRSAEGHLLREGDEIIGAGIRSASAAADEEWRLPMATALVASLATDVFTLLGVDRSELDDVAATMPGGA